MSKYLCQTNYIHIYIYSDENNTFHLSQGFRPKPIHYGLNIFTLSPSTVRVSMTTL